MTWFSGPCHPEAKGGRREEGTHRYRATVQRSVYAPTSDHARRSRYGVGDVPVIGHRAVAFEEGAVQTAERL